MLANATGVALVNNHDQEIRLDRFLPWFESRERIAAAVGRRCHFTFWISSFHPRRNCRNLDRLSLGSVSVAVTAGTSAQQPNWTVEQILFTDERICSMVKAFCSAVERVLSTREQILLTAQKSCSTPERVLSTAEPPFMAGHPFLCPAAFEKSFQDFAWRDISLILGSTGTHSVQVKKHNLRKPRVSRSGLHIRALTGGPPRWRPQAWHWQRDVAESYWNRQTHREG